MEQRAYKNALKIALFKGIKVGLIFLNIIISYND
jgi:hypothetical protein